MKMNEKEQFKWTTIEINILIYVADYNLLGLRF